MKITKKMSNILDAVYYLDYPEHQILTEEDVKWLFHQIYRKGYEDAIRKIESAVEDVANQVDKKL